MRQLNRSTFLDASKTVRDRIENLLALMTLDEKIGQMTQVEKNSITPDDVTRYSIGSVLSGGGGNPTPNTPQTWARMVRSFAEAALETRLGIPLIYGSDAVHGHSNVKGATIFPHNIGLGATRDPALVERVARVTARELLATGVRWNFAPAVSVPQDIRWGRTYEGFSEDAELVAELGAAYVRGLQHTTFDGHWVLPSVKHFVGDGGTLWDSVQTQPWLDEDNWQAPNRNYKIDQGDMQIDEAGLRRLHLKPYIAAIKEGVLNIMVSFSSWNQQKMHNNKYLLTDVVKGELGFRGFLVSDWQAIDQLKPDFYSCVVESINAGLDMVMVPYDFKRFLDTLREAVQRGDISPQRIDDAVTRILLAKFSLGLFEKPLAEEAWLEMVGSTEHRLVAQEAVRKSLVLLKNEHNTLPLEPASRINVAGPAADDIGLACGGWSIEWQGGHGPITSGTTFLDGLKNAAVGSIDYSAEAEFSEHADVGIVVIAEEPYAEGHGDQADLTIGESERERIQRTREHCDKLVLVIYSGRPLIIADVVDLCDAVVAGWLPGTEAGSIADVLFGARPFTGKLPYSWPLSMEQIPLASLKASSDPPLWPFGHGLTTEERS